MKGKFMKYPFLILVLATSLGFGGYRLMQAAQAKVADGNTQNEDFSAQEAGVEEADMPEEADTEGQNGEDINKNQNTHAETDKKDANKKDENRKDANKKDANKNIGDVPDPVSKEKPETNNKHSFKKVTMKYLEGALFIGDSRTSTLYEYAGWDKTDFYVEYGLTIWSVLDAEIVSQKGTGKKITVRQGLKETKYDTIYIMLGINELGRGTPKTYQKQFRKVLEEIREIRPEATIFLQSIMHVTDAKDKEGSYINNKEINARNKKLKILADNMERIFFIDENEVFDQPSTGKLNPEYSSDGVHIKAKYIDIWRDFLLGHGIEK